LYNNNTMPKKVLSQIDKLKKELKQQKKNNLKNTFLKKEKDYYELPNVKKENDNKEENDNE